MNLTLNSMNKVWNNLCPEPGCFSDGEWCYTHKESCDHHCTV